MNIKEGLLYGVPLSIISSAIIIPSIQGFNEKKKSFLIYESTFSDVLGLLMFSVIIGALKNEGEVTGVITQRLKDVEVAHKSLTKLFIVDSMHERKAKMAEISDAIISLPGGVGTWEEFFEALAWNQLGIHSKPIILLNVEGYYDELYAFTKKACHEGFLPQSTLDDFYLTNSVKDSLSIINTFTPKDKSLWYKRLKE